MPIVGCTTTLFGGGCRAVAAFDADARGRVVAWDFLSYVGGSVGDRWTSKSLGFLRTGFPRAPSANVFRCHVFDTYGATLVKSRMDRGGGCVANGGSMLFRVAAHPWRGRRRRRHAVRVFIMKICFFGQRGWSMGHYTVRQRLGDWNRMCITLRVRIFDNWRRSINYRLET